MAASNAENRMNLAALQQCDPYIDGIVQTATQVALYTFNGSANEWEKTDIEGSLFVYSRSATPHNGFMIMNRLSMHNLTEPVTKDLEFQHQDPFLLYRNAKSIYGLWFYDKQECARVTKVMNGLVHKAKQRSKASVRQRSVSESSPRRPAPNAAKEQTKPVDIMQMLSKAQDEYNQSNVPEPSQVASGLASIVRPIPVKAKDKGQKGQRSKDDRGSSEVRGHGAPHQASKIFQRSVSMQEKPSQIPPALQKLLQSGVAQRKIDHPLTKGEVMTVESLEDVHTKTSDTKKSGVQKPSQKEGQFRTVESIESIHRSTGGTSGKHEQSVPIQNLLAQLQKQQPSNIAAQGTIPHAASDSSLTSLLSSLGSDNQSKQQVLSESNPDMMQTLLANLSSPKSSGLLLPHHLTQGSSPASSGGGGSPGMKPVLGAEGGGHQVPSLQQIASGGVPVAASGNALLQCLSTPESAESVFQTSPQRIPASIAPPTLLTPQVFRQRATSDVSSPLLTSITPVLTTSGTSQSGGDIGTDRRKTVPALSIGVGQLAGQIPVRVDPLTKEQFQEAFVQLIRTDDDFLSKLHGAYLSTQQQK